MSPLPDYRPVDTSHGRTDHIVRLQHVLFLGRVLCSGQYVSTTPTPAVVQRIPEQNKWFRPNCDWTSLTVRLSTYPHCSPKVGWKFLTLKRKQWMTMIQDSDECFDVDLLSKLWGLGMTLDTLSNIFRLYHTENHIQNMGAGSLQHPSPVTPDTPVTPTINTPSLQRDRFQHDVRTEVCAWCSTLWYCHHCVTVLERRGHRW